jgi:hypothetical protein
MANSDKNIIITPNIGQTADPKIVFSGADATTAAQNISLYAYPTDSGTLSFEGSAGQLFSITNSLTGTIFSVNDVSGIPSIEVDDTGTIRLAEFAGNVLIGTATDNGTDALQVDGSVSATSFVGPLTGNASTATTLATARAIALTGAVTGTANFDGSAGISITTTATADPTLTLAGDATGSATFTNLGNATLTVAIANDSHTHNYTTATDDRDMKPNTSGIGSGASGLKAFFSSYNGMTSTAQNANYQDVLVLDTYVDTSAGNANAITMDKSDGSMRIWNAVHTATSWGTPQRIFADNYHPNADTLTTARTINGVSFNGSANITVADATKLPLAGGTMTGQIISTLANNTATGGGQIFLNGATGNRIDFVGAGVAAPTFTTRSVGTKIVLYPVLTASDADYALGIDSSTFWSSVSSTSRQFKWYGGTTLAMTLSGTGNLTSVGSVSATALTSTGGSLTLAGWAIDASLHSINNTVYYDNAVHNFTGTIVGSGASITSLNGSNISTGTVAAARVATLNQNTTGSAATLTTARSIALTGAVTGTANFDGSAGISITTTATSDPTLTLAGDLSGSATFTNLGNATLTATLTGNNYQKKTIVQDAAPSGTTGDFWYESDTTVLHVYYNGAWIDTAPGLQTSDNLQINSLGVGTAASGVAGEIRATNDVVAYYSDARLKNFEGKIDSALDKVKQLNGYYFTENETAKKLGYANDKRQVGVSAQEVEAVLPEIVTEAPISNEYLTVKYEKLAPLFIEAIKEIDEKYQAKYVQQQAQIDMLLEEINKLIH